MSVVGDTLSRRDIAQLARAHVEALPDSLVSLVGERFARTFYAYASASADELVLTERDGAALIGACLVSLAPETLSRRLLQRTSLSLHAALAVHRLPLRAMLASARGPKAPPQPPGPEILLIFTLPEVRSRGVGARLLARCEELLAARGIPRLFVKTRDDAANRALQFYARAEFLRIATRTKYGKRLALFEKPLRGTS
ncbi:MAG: GNAT family N-acetyltransferase [Deltaproteobacteria bacterium]|nr:GNAT family N-acetyltransferase [Deltaproteobacteria bacterium]